MPYTKTATLIEASLFASLGALQVSLDELTTLVDAGAKLELEQSTFGDEGEDYSRLLLDKKVIGFIPGY